MTDVATEGSHTAVSCSMLPERSDGRHSSLAETLYTNRQRLQPTWRMKRRSALDRHAAYVKRVERHRLAQEQSGQEHAESKLIAAHRLRTFTRKLRHAILSNADVATVWRPAARTLDIKATLDSKLSGAGFQASHAAVSASQKSLADTSRSEVPSSVLDEMSQLVDTALSQAPPSPDSLAAGNSNLIPVPSGLHDRQSRQLSDWTGAAAKAGAAAVLSELDSTAGQLQQSDNRQVPTRTSAESHRTIAEGSERLNGSTSSKSVGSRKMNKPAWALTADAAQDAEQQEEEDLLAFAGGLEFDKYINEQEDAELRTVLQEMRITSDSNTDANKATLKRHVVRAINNLAGKDVKDSAKNDTAVDAQSSAQQSDGAASTFSRATAASKARDAGNKAALLAASQTAADNAAKWDSSTKAGSDVGSMGNLDKDTCGELFRENPEMRKVHSVASAAALLKRVAITGAG